MELTVGGMMQGQDFASHSSLFTGWLWSVLDFREIEDHDGAVVLCDDRGVGERFGQRMASVSATATTSTTHSCLLEAAVDGAGTCRGELGCCMLVGCRVPVWAPSGSDADVGVGLDGGSGLRYWQLLPICEEGPGESPIPSPASLNLATPG